jgi:hypothetical protein
MAEKIKINLSNGIKKSSDGQFLKASRNWEKCSDLIRAHCSIVTVAYIGWTIKLFGWGPIKKLFL